MIGGDVRKSEVRYSEASQYLGFDRVEASCGKSAMPGDMGGITSYPDTKCDEVEDKLCSHMVGSGNELGPEPVGGFELVQEEIT